MKVSVDGHEVGTAKGLSGFTPTYVPVGTVYLSAGIHAVSYTFPSANLSPGSAENTLNSLNSMEFEPLESPRTQMVSVSPAQARSICGQPVDWVEIIAGA